MANQHTDRSPRGQNTPGSPRGQNTPRLPRGQNTPGSPRGQNTPRSPRGQNTPRSSNQVHQPRCQLGQAVLGPILRGVTDRKLYAIICQHVGTLMTSSGSSIWRKQLNSKRYIKLGSLVVQDDSRDIDVHDHSNDVILVEISDLLHGLVKPTWRNTRDAQCSVSLYTGLAASLTGREVFHAVLDHGQAAVCRKGRVVEVEDEGCASEHHFFVSGIEEQFSKCGDSGASVYMETADHEIQLVGIVTAGEYNYHKVKDSSLPSNLHARCILFSQCLRLLYQQHGQKFNLLDEANTKNGPLIEAGCKIYFEVGSLNGSGPSTDRHCTDRPSMDRPITDRHCTDRPSMDRPITDRPMILREQLPGLRYFFVAMNICILGFVIGYIFG